MRDLKLFHYFYACQLFYRYLLGIRFNNVKCMNNRKKIFKIVQNQDKSVKRLNVIELNVNSNNIFLSFDGNKNLTVIFHVEYKAFLFKFQLEIYLFYREYYIIIMSILKLYWF